MNAFLRSISACLIVRNEAHCLARCLDSLVGIVHEIIIVDTGSTDRTIEIAQKYTDKIFHHHWNDHYAEARNVALSHASGDWILIIDADEVFSHEAARHLPDYLALPEIQHRPVVLNFRVCSELESDLFSRGLFPNGYGIQFAGRVHEIPVLPGQILPSFHCRELVVWHHTRGTQDVNKQRYYLKLLQQSLLEEVDPNQINHLQKHLGLTYLALHQWRPAWDALSTCYANMASLQITPQDGFYADILKGLVEVGLYLNHPKTKLYALELLAHYPQEPLAQSWGIPAPKWHKGIVVFTLSLLAACQPSEIPSTTHPHSLQNAPLLLQKDLDSRHRKENFEDPHLPISRLGDFRIQYFCPTQSPMSNACYSAGGRPLTLQDASGNNAIFYDEDGYQCTYYAGCCVYDVTLDREVCSGSTEPIPELNGGEEDGGDRVCKTVTTPEGETKETCFSCPPGEQIVFKDGKPRSCSSEVSSDTQQADFGLLRVYDQTMIGPNQCGEQ
ncbi:MAG: glycosyltransferase family 2 protein [Candidatus Sericytochromatia bacterium]